MLSGRQNLFSTLVESAGKIQYSDRSVRNLDRSIRQILVYIYIHIFSPNRKFWNSSPYPTILHNSRGKFDANSASNWLDASRTHIKIQTKMGLTLVATSKWTWPVVYLIVWERDFQQSQIRPLRRIVYTSRFSTGNPELCNTHIYHSHISESLNLDFFKFWGGG
jgi:hypothetical protein